MSIKHRVIGLAALSGLSLAAAPAATAATQTPDSAPAASGLSSLSPRAVTDGLTSTPLYPLAGGPLDLLSNNAALPVGGAKVSTFPVTAPFHHGLPLRDVPIVGSLLP